MDVSIKSGCGQRWKSMEEAPHIPRPLLIEYRPILWTFDSTSFVQSFDSRFNQIVWRYTNRRDKRQRSRRERTKSHILSVIIDRNESLRYRRISIYLLCRSFVDWLITDQLTCLSSHQKTPTTIGQDA